MENFTLDDNVYLLLLLGMVAVGTHAYSLFNQPIERPGATTHWRFLSSIPIELATTQSRFRLGLVFYIVVFELVYLVMSSSSSLLLMTYQMSGRQELTGALSESVSPNGTVPILASTAIILFTQIRPVSHIELMLRRFAHRMARVPDGLKLVKQRASHYLRHANLSKTAFSTDLVRIGGSIDPYIRERLNDSQVIIGWLYENSLGAQGSMAWDAEGSEELTQLFQPIKFEVMQLRNDILETTNREDTETTGNSTDRSSNLQVQGPWHELLNRSLHLEERLTQLLCLLIINQPEIDTRGQDDLAQLIEKTRQRERSEVAEIAIKSCILGVLISIVAVFAFESSWNQFKSDLRSSPYSGKAPFGDYLEARVNANTDNSELYTFDGLTSAERQELTLDYSVKNNLLTAFEETLWAGITFMCAVLVALSMNTQNIHLWRSENQRGGEEPVTHSVQTALIAITALVTSACVLFVYMFITEALLPALYKNVDVLSFDILKPFISLLPTILRFSLAAAVCAVFIVWLDGSFAARHAHKSRELENNGDGNTTPSQRKTLFEISISRFVRMMKSHWISCISAAVFIGTLFLSISAAMEENIELIEAVEKLMIAFISFLCFLLVLATVMKWHKQRYSLATTSESTIEETTQDTGRSGSDPLRENASNSSENDSNGNRETTVA